MEVTSGVLVMFRPDVRPEEVALSLNALAEDILGWAQVFDGKPLYAVKVPISDAKDWKVILRQLPGAAWSEVMSGPPAFEQVTTWQ